MYLLIGNENKQGRKTKKKEEKKRRRKEERRGVEMREREKGKELEN